MLEGSGRDMQTLNRRVVERCASCTLNAKSGVKATGLWVSALTVKVGIRAAECIAPKP